MHAILLSAFNATLGWVLKVVVVKALVFGLLLVVTTEFTEALLNQLANMGATGGVDGITGAINGLPSAALYFIGLLRLDAGIPLILSAYVAGFAIRRLPIIG
jgi:hypothetical protein